MAIERTGHVTKEIREVGELTKVENLRRSPRLIIESHDDRIQISIRTGDLLRYRVALHTWAHWRIWYSSLIEPPKSCGSSRTAFR